MCKLFDFLMRIRKDVTGKNTMPKMIMNYYNYSDTSTEKYTFEVYKGYYGPFTSFNLEDGSVCLLIIKL